MILYVGCQRKKTQKTYLLIRKVKINNCIANIKESLIFGKELDEYERQNFHIESKANRLIKQKARRQIKAKVL